MGHVNPPRTPKLWAISHKNGHKRKNNEFLFMPVKHVLSVMDLENHPKNPKPWTIAHETAQKCKNDGFLVIPLKYLVSVMGPVNHLGNPKQRAIAHENDPKTQKRRVFGHASQTCTDCHIPSKLPQNPKIVDNSSRKRP
jgi:hypothetical protein